jgi:hypothetical protein
MLPAGDANLSQEDFQIGIYGTRDLRTSHLVSHAVATCRSYAVPQLRFTSYEKGRVQIMAA